MFEVIRKNRNILTYPYSSDSCITFIDAIRHVNSLWPFKNFPDPLIVVPLDSTIGGPISDTFVESVTTRDNRAVREEFFQGYEVFNETETTIITKANFPRTQFSIVMWIKGNSGVFKIDDFITKDKKG